MKPVTTLQLSSSQVPAILVEKRLNRTIWLNGPMLARNLGDKCLSDSFELWCSKSGNSLRLWVLAVLDLLGTGAPLTCESRHSSPLVLTGEGGRLTHAAVDLLCAFHLENSYNGVHCGGGGVLRPPANQILHTGYQLTLHQPRPSCLQARCWWIKVHLDDVKFKSRTAHSMCVKRLTNLF